jgi:hypothetical protein
LFIAPLKSLNVTGSRILSHPSTFGQSEPTASFGLYVIVYDWPGIALVGYVSIVTAYVAVTKAVSSTATLLLCISCELLRRIWTTATGVKRSVRDFVNLWYENSIEAKILLNIGTDLRSQS